MPKMNPITVEEAENAKREHGAGEPVHKGKKITRGQIQAALAKVDQPKHINDEDARLETVIWDQESPINGVPAAKVLTLRASDIPSDGTVYLIKDKNTGHVLCFQPFKPGLGGRQQMTEVEAGTIGEGHRSDVANDRARNKIMRALCDELDK